MFCKHCGKEVADGALFCASCGQPTGAAPAPAAAPAAPAQLPAFLKNLLDQVKAILNPPKAIGLAAQSKGLEGIVGLGLFYLIYVFSRVVEAYQGSMGDFYYADGQVTMTVDVSRYVGFGGMFAISLGMGIVYLGFLYAAFFGVVSIATGKVLNPLTCMNILGIALLPSVAAMIVNFGFGFLWTPLASLMSLIATLFLYISLYTAVEKTEHKPVRPYFWIYVALMGAAVVLAEFINNVIYGAYIKLL